MPAHFGMGDRPQARLAVLSMHTSPTAALGHSANGGMNVYVNQLCGAWSRMGVATDIFTRRVGADDPSVEQIAPLSRVVYLPSGPFETDKYGLAAHSQAFAASIADFIRADGREPDLIYSHYWLSGLAGFHLRGSLGLPWAHTSHTLALVKNRQLAPGAKPEPAIRIEAERLIAREADLQIVSTVAEGADLVNIYGADTSRIAVVAPGVDLATFGPMDRAEARAKIGYEGSRILLFVGRLERLKGVEIILRALAQVAARHEDVRLLVLGEDSRDAVESEKTRLRAIVDNLGISSRVDFLGPVAHHELPYFYAAAEACLMPSYSESFGLVGLEAQACGCPVIASNVAGLASVVRDEVTGYLVGGADPATYADRLGRLLDSPQLSELMGRRGILLAQRFDWNHTAARAWDALAQLLEASNTQVVSEN